MPRLYKLDVLSNDLNKSKQSGLRCLNQKELQFQNQVFQNFPL